MDKDAMECPDCGADMVLRRNGETGVRFYGCSTYPECTGTREFDGATKDEGGEAPLSPGERARQNDRQRWRRDA